MSTEGRCINKTLYPQFSKKKSKILNKIVSLQSISCLVMKKKTLLAILFSFFTVNLLTAHSHVIRGTVTDERGQPLPFVTVFLTTSQTGTITNSDGAFALNFSGDPDVLRISFMGYETQTVDVSTSTGFLNIRMRPSAIQLGEFIVSAVSAQELLRKAIERIPYNFQQEPFLVRTYVRDKASLTDTVFFMQETALDIVRSYRRSFSDQYFLVRNRNFRFTSTNNRVRGVGDLDIVKILSNTPSSRFFRSLFRSNNEPNIRYLPNTTFNNRPVYVLELFQENSNNSGRIYIDVEDLAFIRFEFNFENGSRIIVQYEKIGDKYYLMHGTSVSVNEISRGRVVPLETSMITTAIIHSFSRNDIRGTHILPSDILEWYATHEYDVLFWQQHNAILPDSTILRALEKYAEAQRGSGTATVEPTTLTSDSVIPQIPSQRNLQNQPLPQRLYTRNLSLMASSDLASDFSTFNHNLNSANRYVLNQLPRYFRRLIPMLLSNITYNYFILPPLANATSEWLLLNKNGIQARMNPTVFNQSGASHLFGINNSVLSDFKNNNHLNFLRLHTIRHDGAFVRAFLMEEELVRVNFIHGMNSRNYLFLYWMELLQHRAVNLINPFRRRDVRQSNNAENQQPLIIDRGRSWVKYLFNPEMEFQRHIEQRDLTGEEQRYLRRVARWSLLNLVSPQMFFIPRFSIGENLSFTFNAYYLPIPFGEMFGQNFWLMHNHSQLHGMFLRQYRNHERTFFGIGYKLYDVRLFPNMYVTSSIDFWQQPTDFSFRTTSTFNGFRVGQTFEYRLLRNQFSGQSRLSILVGYDYKTKGYMPESFFMGENFNVSVGFRWNFR